MQLFECDVCGQAIFFDNVRCERCGSEFGFVAESLRLAALAPQDDGNWRVSETPTPYQRCANAVYESCNWLVPAVAASAYCLACRFNRTVPDLSDPASLLLWRKIELAKHRLIYQLLRFALPLKPKIEGHADGLAFDFLSDPDPSFRESTAVMTGHADGLITLNIREADDVERERARQSMAEPYRTLIGHFRHEIGHYYWQWLIHPTERLDACRALFGDDRRDYGDALARHYAEGPPPDWRERHVSSYAACHPWEDFAETWAHYMHIVDTLDTAAAFGISLSPRVSRARYLSAAISFDPYTAEDFDALVAAWLPVVVAVNALNDSMGQPSLYPFVLTPPVIDKLRFVHETIRPLAPPGAARPATG